MPRRRHAPISGAHTRLAREGWGVRFFDLILALMVLWGLVVIGRHQFPVYEGKSYVPAVAASASPTPAP